MPDTTLARSLSDRIEAMRARQGDSAAPPEPPAVAARSVLVDIVLDDLAATMPAPLAVRIGAADSPGTAVDWLFAGAVYRTVADDPYLASQFLTLVGDDPRAAGVALVRALASKQEPPPRDAAWHRCDHLGLWFQLGAAAIVLAARVALFVALASLIRPPATPPAQAELARTMCGIALFEAGQSGGPKALVWLTFAVVWAGLEASRAPRLLETLRRLPAKLRGAPAPLSWRADTFEVLWRVQTGLVFIVVLAALCRALAVSIDVNLNEFSERGARYSVNQTAEVLRKLMPQTTMEAAHPHQHEVHK